MDIAHLLDMGVRHIDVTAREGGVLVADRAAVVSIRSHKVPVVDTTPAGDALVSAFAVAM